MDSITQFMLGAALGEAVLNRPKAESPEAPRARREMPFGWGAVLLGGLFGTLPDLDVLAEPFLTGPQALGFHRGVTHSIFLCTAASPLFALLLARLFASRRISFQRWLAFVWLVLNTHWMIDALTTYGTQVFLPFTNYPVNLDAVFISDPLYLGPLTVGVLATRWRSRVGHGSPSTPVRWALLFTTIYLGSALVSKAVVWQRFEASLEQQGVKYRQMMTTPTPFNTLLWYAYVDLGEEVLVADASLFDRPGRAIVWQTVPKNLELVSGFDQSAAGRRLLWFSRGFYRFEMDGEIPVFIDLRFGRLKSWLRPVDPEGRDYVFQFALVSSDEHGAYHDFKRLKAEGGVKQFPTQLFLRRLLGRPGEH